MEVSKNGIDLIAGFEGFVSKPYLDAVGIPTIGYGNTFYLNGKKVTMFDTPINEMEARKLLSIIANKFGQQVKEVTRELNQNQFDAVVSFVYNVGIGNYKKSTLLKKINANPCDASIAYEFSRWNKAGGKVLAGLTKRRKKEAELYFKA